MIRKTKELKEKIETLEYQRNGFNKLNGAYVKTVNLKVRKDKVFADVILITDAESGNNERYNNCEYPLDKLKNVL